MTENGVEALARGCPKIKKFSSKGCKQVNDRAVICLATYCPNIEVLNLHSCDVSTLFEKKKNNKGRVTGFAHNYNSCEKSRVFEGRLMCEA